MNRRKYNHSCKKGRAKQTISREHQGKSYPSPLDELLEEEVAAKELCRIETTLKISGLLFMKSIDELDFTFQPSLNKQKIMGLFDLSFTREKGNVIFLGPLGMGNTHLAVALLSKPARPV